MGTLPSKIEERTLAVKLPSALLSRLRMESLRSERLIREIVASALDECLPAKIEVTATPSPRSRRTSSGNS